MPLDEFEVPFSISGSFPIGLSHLFLFLSPLPPPLILTLTPIHRI
jgi:hypothetical protein